MNKPSQDLDYQETIRAAALAFLDRHQGEHLGAPGQFLKRAKNHLIDHLEVNEALASQLVDKAYMDLLDLNARHRVDMQATGEAAVVITDPVRGFSWSVPAWMIYEQLVSTGRATRITPAT